MPNVWTPANVPDIRKFAGISIDTPEEIRQTGTVIVIYGPPGCLSYDTTVMIRRSNHVREYDLATLFNCFRGIHYSKVWDKSIKTNIASLKDGIIQYRPISDIVYSGVKLTYVVKVGDNEPFRCTGDHRFLTPDGYVNLDNLSVGDLIVVQGKPITSEKVGRNKETRREVTARYHPLATWREINGGWYSRIRYSRLVIEADLNDMPVEELIHILQTDEERAENLIYASDEIQIHHIDGHPSNNALDNLQPMYIEEHSKLHGQDNIAHFGEHSHIYSTTVMPIVSIVEYRGEKTFDITMQDEEAPNFLVNGVVVHNSGKTALADQIVDSPFVKRGVVWLNADAGHDVIQHHIDEGKIQNITITDYQQVENFQKQYHQDQPWDVVVCDNITEYQDLILKKLEVNGERQIQHYNVSQGKIMSLARDWRTLANKHGLTVFLLAWEFAKTVKQSEGIMSSTVTKHHVDLSDKLSQRFPGVVGTVIHLTVEDDKDHTRHIWLGGTSDKTQAKLRRDEFNKAAWTIPYDIWFKMGERPLVDLLETLNNGKDFPVDRYLKNRRTERG